MIIVSKSPCGRLETTDILPRGDNGHIIKVGGMDVRLIGGKVFGKTVFLSSFSRRGL